MLGHRTPDTVQGVVRYQQLVRRCSHAIRATKPLSLHTMIIYTRNPSFDCLRKRFALRCTHPSVPVKKKSSGWPPPVASMTMVSSILTLSGVSVRPPFVFEDEEARHPRTTLQGFFRTDLTPETISGGGVTSRAMLRYAPDASCPASRCRRRPGARSRALSSPAMIQSTRK